MVTTQNGQPGRRRLLAARWYHGWNVIGVSILFQAVTIGLMFYSFSFWIAPLTEAFDVKAHSILIAGTLGQIAIGLTSPFAGHLFDTRSIRLLTTAGMALFCVGFFLISCTTALWQVITLYVLFLAVGTAFAGTLPAQVLVSRWFVNKRGTALGISALGASLGGFAFPPIVTVLMASHGWRATNMILGLGAAVVMVPLILLIVRDKRPGDVEPGEKPRPEGAEPAPKVKAKLPILQILKNKNALILLFWFLSLTMVFTAFQLNVAPIAGELSVSPQKASFLLSAMTIIMIAGKVVFGALSDRLAHRYLLWAALGFMMISFTGLLFARSYASLFVCIIFMGLSGGGFLPLLAASVAKVFGAHFVGRVIGTMSPIFIIGATGPLIMSLIRERFGSYDAAFLVILVFLAIAAIAVSFFDEKPSTNRKAEIATP